MKSTGEIRLNKKIADDHFYIFSKPLWDELCNNLDKQLPHIQAIIRGDLAEIKHTLNQEFVEKKGLIDWRFQLPGDTAALNLYQIAAAFHSQEKTIAIWSILNEKAKISNSYVCCAQQALFYVLKCNYFACLDYLPNETNFWQNLKLCENMHYFIEFGQDVLYPEQLEAIFKLIDKGINLDQTEYGDFFHNTWYSLLSYIPGLDLEQFKTLADKLGTEVDANELCYKNVSLLDMATACGNLEIVEFLLQKLKGAPLRTNKEHCTALDLLYIENEYFELPEVICKKLIAVFNKYGYSLDLDKYKENVEKYSFNEVLNKETLEYADDITEREIEIQAATIHHKKMLSWQINQGRINRTLDSLDRSGAIEVGPYDLPDIIDLTYSRNYRFITHTVNTSHPKFEQLLSDKKIRLDDFDFFNNEEIPYISMSLVDKRHPTAIIGNDEILPIQFILDVPTENISGTFTRDAFTPDTRSGKLENTSKMTDYKNLLTKANRLFNKAQAQAQMTLLGKDQYLPENPSLLRKSTIMPEMIIEEINHLHEGQNSILKQKDVLCSVETLLDKTYPGNFNELLVSPGKIKPIGLMVEKVWLDNIHELFNNGFMHLTEETKEKYHTILNFMQTCGLPIVVIASDFSATQSLTKEIEIAAKEYQVVKYMMDKTRITSPDKYHRYKFRQEDLEFLLQNLDIEYAYLQNDKKTLDKYRTAVPMLTAFERILSQKISINRLKRFFHHSVKSKKNFVITKLLVKAGMNPNCHHPDTFRSAYQTALEHSNFYTAMFLVSEGAQTCLDKKEAITELKIPAKQMIHEKSLVFEAVTNVQQRLPLMFLFGQNRRPQGAKTNILPDTENGPFERIVPHAKRYYKFWERADKQLYQPKLLQLIADQVINQPYEEDQLDYLHYHDNPPTYGIIHQLRDHSKKNNSRYVYHRHHDVGHAISQLCFAFSFYDLIKNNANGPWQEVASHLTNEEITGVLLAAFCFRAGRSNENPGIDDTSNAQRSANIFRQVAYDLGIDELLADNIAACIDHHIPVGSDSTDYFSDGYEGTDEIKIKKSIMVKCVLDMSHHLHLIRMNPAEEVMPEVDKQLELFFDSKVQPDISKKMLDYAQLCCLLTGTSVVLTHKDDKGELFNQTINHNINQKIITTNYVEETIEKLLEEQPCCIPLKHGKSLLMH